jgi:Rod binding domain-containing protein
MPAPLTSGVDGKIEMLRRMPEREARPQAAKQLEVEFLAQLLSALRKTVPRNDFLPKAPSRDVYDGLFDHAVAERMAAGDPLGLAHLLAQPSQPGEGLKLRQGTAEEESAAPGLAGRK